MAYTPDKLRKQEEDCIHRFKTDCARIEQQQDDIKNQRKCLQEIIEQINLDSERAYRQVEEYYYTKDATLYHLMTGTQNQIVMSQGYTQRFFDEHQEDLRIEKCDAIGTELDVYTSYQPARV